MTSALIDPATDTRESDEPAPPCTARREILATGVKTECEKQATWVGLLRCCGFVKHLCDEHKEIFTNIPDRHVLHCRECKTPYRANPFAVLERL